MDYLIHGKPVSCAGELGMYIFCKTTMRHEYAILIPDLLVAKINRYSAEAVILGVEQLIQQVTDQSKWQDVPAMIGSPFLKVVDFSPKQIPITEVKPHIVNTKQFFEAVLNALQGLEL